MRTEEEGTERVSHLAGTAHTHATRAGEVAAEDVRVAFVYRRADVVELGDERVLEPVDEHLRD